MVDTKEPKPHAVDIGIILGDTKLQGKFSFITTGSQRDKYKKIPTTIANNTMEIFNASLKKRDRVSKYIHDIK